MTEDQTRPENAADPLAPADPSDPPLSGLPADEAAVADRDPKPTENPDTGDEPVAQDGDDD